MWVSGDSRRVGTANLSRQSKFGFVDPRRDVSGGESVVYVGGEEDVFVLSPTRVSTGTTSCVVGGRKRPVPGTRIWSYTHIH